MTGIDLLIIMMLNACVASTPVALTEGFEGTLYECPLIGNEARFTVVRRVCSHFEEYAIAIRDQRNGKGFYLNQFQEVSPAYVEVAGNHLYTPKCETE